MWKSPGPVGPRSMWVWRGLTYLGGRGLSWGADNPLATFLITMGLSAGIWSGRMWISRVTWELLFLTAKVSLRSTWQLTRGSGAIFMKHVPGVSSTVSRAGTAGSSIMRWSRSPAGKGAGAGLFIGTLLTYPVLVKEGYIVPSVVISQEQMMKELVSKPGLPPGLGTRPILFGGGGGGIIV